MDILTFIASLFTAMSAVATALGVRYVGRQLEESKKMNELSQKIAKSEFLLKMQERSDKFVKIYLKLKNREMNDFNFSVKGDELVELSRYIGHIESLQLFVEDGILDLNDVDRLYSHRIYDIIKNENVRKRYFEEESPRWENFIKLWKDLEEMKVYKYIKESEERKLLASHNDPIISITSGEPLMSQNND